MEGYDEKDLPPGWAIYEDENGEVSSHCLHYGLQRFFQYLYI